MIDKFERYVAEGHKRYVNDEHKGRINCLRCDKVFMSGHRINIRICGKCKTSSEWLGSRSVDFLLPSTRDKHLSNAFSPLAVDSEAPKVNFTRFRKTRTSKKAG